MSRHAIELQMPNLNIIALASLSMELTDATGSGAPIARMTVRVAISKVAGESL